MPLDSSIYGLIRPQQPPPNPVEQYGQAMQLKSLINQNRIQEQAMADERAYKAAAMESGEDQSRLPQLLRSRGLPKQAMEALKGFKEALKQDNDLLASFAAASANELKSVTPENWAGYRDLQAQRAGMFSTTQFRNSILKKVQEMPVEYNPDYVAGNLVKAEEYGQALASGLKPGTPEWQEWWKRKSLPQGRGEYITPVQTAGGIKGWDTRRGAIVEPAGGPVIGSASDPNLQGRLSGAKRFGQAIGEEAAGADRGAEALASLNEARAILDKGIYSGFYGDMAKTSAKAIPGIDKTKAANTETYLSHIGNIVIPRLKDFGGSDTVEELKYLQNVMAGRIDFEEPAMRAIIDSVERKLNAKAERLNKQARQVGIEIDTKPTGAPDVSPRIASDSLHDPAQFKGRTMTDTATGIKYRSDGKRWLRQ